MLEKLKTALTQGNLKQFIDENYYSIDKETLAVLCKLLIDFSSNKKATQLKILKELEDMMYV